MKNYKLITLFVGVLLAGSLSAQQYDDIYYDPDQDRKAEETYRASKPAYSNTNRSYSATRQNESEQQQEYDDENYAYYDDYDYYYSSRIRRFQRPLYGFDFFDPVYVDMAYYDPFMAPGATVLIYDDVFAFNSWRRWNRWNRWNNWGFNNWGWDPWGWNMGFGWNTGFGMGLGWNNWGWNRWNTGWGFNNWGWNSFGGGFACPPTWGNGYVYNTVNDLRNNTVYGPRTSGGMRVPRTDNNDRDIRREGPKDVTNTPRPGTGIPQDRTRVPSDNDAVTPRDSEPSSTPGTRARAHEERRRATQSDDYQPDRNTVTPRERTPRESDTPRRSYEPRQSTPDRNRSYDGGSSRNSSPRMDSGSSRSGGDSGSRSSSGSSSGPRSGGSSRRGGN
jgi:hypothetical protein